MKALLEELGFKEKEAAVYLALVEHPNSSATSLAKYLPYDRRTIYDIISILFQKGYIKHFSENKVNKYVVVDPKILVTELDEKKEKLLEMLPQLEKLKPKESQNIELFRGKRGFIYILQEILDRKALHYAFGSISATVPEYYLFIKNYLLEYDKLKLGEKVIFEEGYDHMSISNGEYRYLKKELVPPTTTFIYDNIVVLMLNDEEQTIIRIENNTIAQSYLSHFNVYWNLAKSRK